MKEKRNLSGIYFSYKNTETGKIESRCFEDLPKEDQDEILNSPDVDIEYLKRLCKMLANTLNEVGDEADIISE